MTDLDYRARCLKQQISACVGCGQREDLIVHHINGDRDDNRLENLVPVCRSCHTKIHTGNDVPEYLQKYREQLDEDSKDWLKSDYDGERVTITVSDEVWEELNRRKTKPGMTFDDVLRQLLHINDNE